MKACVVLLTAKPLVTGDKNEVQYPAVNSKHSHACRVQ